MNPARARVNWPLTLGAILVVAVALAALFGPALAPRDPTATVFILQDYDGEWVKPPFPPWRVPGYPLGSDNQGRDLWSQLLWAVRPTLAMVTTVALLRLALGTLVGLWSGWSAGRQSRWLDTAISAALAVPTLIVALAVIAVLGIEAGVVAFILGLSITGWAETARLVREQTRAIKDQLYIEAARALGQPDSQIIFRHVLRQILPILWMVFAFEVSATLLTTATLGFLGYYLGGGVWFQVDDFVMQRITGQPELGQMLAIAAESRDRPESMLFAGSIVFLTVMGFNLLGEGLRIQLMHEQATGRDSLFDHAVSWIDAHVVLPASDWAAANPGLLRGLVSAIAFVVTGAGLLWWARDNNLFAAPPSQQAVAIAGANLWASQRRDPQGSLTADVAGPSDASIVWSYSAPEAFVGGPVVAADGTIYVPGVTRLYAIEPTGQLRWEAALPSAGIGSPALGAAGTVYVVHADGALSAISPEASLLWQAPPLQGARAISGPIVNQRNGLIYYALEGYVRAVTPDGQVAFVADIPYSYISPLPRLDPPGEQLIFEDLLFSADTGELLGEATFNPLDRYMVGADGRLYLQEETSVTVWQPGAAEAPPPVQWNLAGFAFGFPTDSGVTYDGFVWLAFNSGFQDTRIVWADLKGNVLGTVIIPQRNSHIVGTDVNSTLFLCGNSRARAQGAACEAYDRGASDPRWRLTLERGSGAPIGGALVSGRLYVVTDNGRLTAVGK